MKTLKVKGTGKASFKVDLIVFKIKIKNIDLDYNKSIERNSYLTEDLKNKIKEGGFNPDDIKTRSWDINTEYSSEKVKEGYTTKEVSVFKGYESYHSLVFELDFSKENLFNVISSISKCENPPEFNIDFSIKDKSNANDEVLINAINDSKRKAEIIASASGLDLGDIVNIDYHWTDVTFESPTYFSKMELNLFSAPDISPEDIILKDSVSIVWEIK